MRYMSYGIMFYMLMALVWWTILLSKYNRNTFESKTTTIQLIHEKSATNSGISYTSTPEYTKIKNQFERNKTMILGEGFVFGVSLIIGLYFIQKAYLSEVDNTKRQKNFLLSITHELKSPITAIKLTADTIKSRKISPAQQTELCDNILSENNRLEKLINNLLLASRINNAYAYNFEYINLREVIDGITPKLKKIHPNHAIDVIYGDFDHQIVADKEAIYSLFYNLIENGIKYSPKLTPIVIQTNTSNGFVNVFIKDLGVGIPIGERVRIFEQFYRIGQEETRTSKGTGLGLYIVNRITNAHNGKITITENLPNGSIFKVALPIKQKNV
jgi:K+-sensing histidine kinase KdpD